MEYNDFKLPNDIEVASMNEEFNNKVITLKTNQMEVCEMGELRQKAELEDIFIKLKYCEGFFNWLEGQDSSFNELKKIISHTQNDAVTTLGCCGRYGLDYRYACPETNYSCANYCRCEMEILDKIIKLMTLKSGIVDKNCMITLLKSRMEILRLVFGKYCK